MIGLTLDHSQVDSFARDVRSAAGHMPRLIGEALQTSTDKKAIYPIVVASARAIIPVSGGLAAEVIGGLRIHNTLRRTGSGVHVVLAGRRRGMDLEGLDQGIVKHPTYGHRPWKAQRIRPGWWSIPLGKFIPNRVRNELLRKLDKLRDLIKRR